MKTILVIGISLVLLTAGTALAAKGGNPEPPAAAGNMELVGFTTVTTLPNIGLFAMTELCQVDYLDSRMCTSEEIMKTVNIPVLPSDTKAWVQPVITTRVSSEYTDISGITGTYSVSCSNWSYIGNPPILNGLTVTNLGVLGNVTCHAPGSILPVACCAPAQ